MAQRIIQLVLSILLCIIPVISYSAKAETLPKESSVVINELQLNGSAEKTTGEEFVELTNITDVSVDVGGWKLQYIASTGNRGTAKYFATIPEHTIIYPQGHFLVAPEGYLGDLSPRLTYSITLSFTGLAAAGGTVELTNSLGVVVDAVGWGVKTTTICEAESSEAPPDGSSIQRRVADAKTVDTDNNKNDFEILTVPTPSVANVAPEESPPDPDTEPVIDTAPPTEEPISALVPDPAPTEQQTQAQNLSEEPTVAEAVQNTDIAPIITEQPILVNELFIDPVSPQTDANDEWVELYNPNEMPQDLNGYTIYAGETFAYHHTFSSGNVIPPHGYISITSGATSIALANGGGAVKVVGPSGAVYDLTLYDAAKTAYSWAKDSTGIWRWSTTPTQDGANVITEPVAIAVVTKAAATAKNAPAKAVQAKSTTIKAKATTPAKVAVAKTTKVKAVTDTAVEPALVAAPSPLPAWLLAVLGTLAVLYSAYEYRFDMANKIYQFRANRAARARNRRTS